MFALCEYQPKYMRSLCSVLIYIIAANEGLLNKVLSILQPVCGMLLLVNCVKETNMADETACG